MTVKVQHLRNTTASTRPTSAALLDGEIALNLSAGTTGAFYKDASSNIIKIGSAEVGGAAPNSTPGLVVPLATVLVNSGMTLATVF